MCLEPSLPYIISTRAMSNQFWTSLFLKWRSNYWLQLFTVNLRFLIGFGFIPSGIRKIVGMPFANPGQSGAFFEYLDALYATGFYYEFIGWAQLLAAVLLMTQRFATIGAFMFLPIILNIMIFTLSTIGSLTPVIATLMCLGIFYLLLWDHYKWMGIFNFHRPFAFPLADQIQKQSPYWTKVGIATIVVPVLVMIGISILGPSQHSFMKQMVGFHYLIIAPITPFIATIWHIARRKN